MELRDIENLSSKEITFFILKLAAAGLLVGAVFIAPGIGILAQYFPSAGHRDKQRIKRHLKSVHKKGLVRFDANKLESRVVLTHEGEVYMNEELLFKLHFEKPTKWNGKWFAVLFDIPVSKGEKVRHLLRLKLLELGFVTYQGSVYVFPYYCRPLINDIEKILGIKNCIQTMVVDKLDGEEALKKHFSIS